MSAPNALFSETILLLGGAVVAAPIFKKLGLGTVLGYLAAGVVIGPIFHGITDGEQILDVAELGVVFLLFIIGLELKPSRLWQMRRDIFGLGTAQVVLTGLALTALAYLSGVLDWRGSIVAGFGLALSSTAFAMQILEETGDVNTRYGQRSFSMLLLQDLAIVPLLALITILDAGKRQRCAASGLCDRSRCSRRDDRHGALSADAALPGHRQDRRTRGDDRGRPLRRHGFGEPDAVCRAFHGDGRVSVRRHARRILLPA